MHKAYCNEVASNVYLQGEIQCLEAISAGLLDALKTLVSEHDARQAKYTIPTEPLGIVLARAAIAKAEI